MKYNSTVFKDLSFLRSHVEYFKCLLETDICSKIDYDVEFFFLAYFNFSEQAKSLAVKYNEHFKAFVSFSLLDISAEFLIQKTFHKKSYYELSVDEIIIYRKILNSIIKRKLYVGIDYFLNNKMFCCLLSEGRLWSSIIKTFTCEEVMALWLKYEISLDDIKQTPMKKTIDIEYSKKMNKLVYLIKEEENEMLNNSINPKNFEEREMMKKSYKYSIEKMEMELELEMGIVISIADLIRIMILSDHKNTVFFFFKTLPGPVFTIEIQKAIFDYIIEQDEETSLFFLMTIASNEIIEEKHMKSSLMNQFFQLALELSKIDKCKQVLNSSPPNTEHYFSYFHKFNYQHKIATYKRLTLRTMSDNSEIDIIPQKLNKFNTTYLISNFEIQNRLEQTVGQSEPNNTIIINNNSNSNNNINDTMNNPNETNANLLNISRTPSIPLINPLHRLNINDKRTTKNIRKNNNKLLHKTKSTFANSYKGKGKELKQRICNPHFKNSIDKMMNTDINVQMILIDQLRFGEHAFCCLCLLCSINEGNLILEYADKICKNLLVLTKEKDEIIKCRSPILLCVLSAEFILKIGRLNKKMHFKCETVADSLIRLAESFQSEIKDENMLKYYLTEQVDNQMRNALEIISENRFVSLLNTNIVSIINKHKFTKGESIISFFRIPRLLFSYGKEQTFNQVLSIHFFPSNVSFNFQFNQFITDFDLKTKMLIMNSIVFSIMFISYLSFVFYSCDKKDYRYSIPSYIYAFLIFIQYILHFIYIKKTGKKLFLSGIEYFNNIGIIFGIVLCESHFYFRLDQSNDFVDYVFYLGFFLIVLCNLSEIMVHLQNTSIGNIIRVISDMFNQLLGFIGIFLCFTVFCSQLFLIYFKNSNSDFTSLYTAIKTLFSAAFGIYYFYNFNELDFFGQFCLMLYIAASNLCLMNLFIAIINNLFQKHTDNNLAEERAVAISVNKKLKWDRMYGSLILMPPPFSFLTFILSFSFLLANTKRIEDVNLRIAKILYGQLALCIFIFYFIISVALWPIAIIKGFLMKFVDTFIITDEEFIFRNNTIQYVCYVIFLPFILLKYLFEDSYFYWSLVYKENTSNDTSGTKIPITKETINTLRDILLQIKWKDEKKISSVNDISEKYFLNQKHDDALNQNNTHLTIGPISMTSKPTFHNLLFSKQKIPNELRYLIDKITDEDQQINIDLALRLIVQRESYNNRFLEYLYYFNLKQLKRGLQKFSFANEAYSSTYSFKKLQNLIYKLMIKFKMLYTLFPNEMMSVVRPKLEYFNLNLDYSKKVVLKEKRGNHYSDYEDEEEEKEELKKINPILSMLSPLI